MRDLRVEEVFWQQMNTSAPELRGSARADRYLSSNALDSARKLAHS